MLQKRTNILFDEVTWEMLSELAKKEHKSKGELTREAVRKMYMEDKIQEDRQKAHREIQKIRKKIRSTFTGEEIKEMINYGRKY